MSEALTPDSVLLAATEQARSALLEITPADSIGSHDGYVVEGEHVLTQFFECRLPGYPGWRWAATLTRTSEEAPITVLEVELLPGEGAVIAPEWVPWSERLAQYRDAQSRQSGGDEGDEHDNDDLDDEFDADEDDLDDELELDADAASDVDLDDDEDDDEGLADDADDTELFAGDTDDVDDDDDDTDGDDADDDDAEGGDTHRR
ncbi:DUF3027 domain-containing protein [Leucobacter musarum]|uniref:DUF3027 domain-containing protein n=1 Tax=Leucobacter musarum TaxID=1930747 RepID=UPI0006A7DBB4|nr:DUF3027 domain-containing protein [Leucobacter musarum]